jgi:hypothetical protein
MARSWSGIRSHAPSSCLVLGDGGRRTAEATQRTGRRHLCSARWSPEAVTHTKRSSIAGGWRVRPSLLRSTKRSRSCSAPPQPAKASPSTITGARTTTTAPLTSGRRTSISIIQSGLWFPAAARVGSRRSRTTVWHSAVRRLCFSHASVPHRPPPQYEHRTRDIYVSRVREGRGSPSCSGRPARGARAWSRSLACDTRRPLYAKRSKAQDIKRLQA